MKQSISVFVETSIGQSMKRTWETIIIFFLSRRKLHGMPAMTFLRRLTAFFRMNFLSVTEYVSVAVRSIMFTMKATISLKRLAYHVQENRLRKRMMMFMTLWLMLSKNGAAR